MQKIRCGVIGIKGVGRYHIDILRHLPHAELTALVDIDAEFVNQKADELGIRAFANYQDMLAAGLVDAVTIATPHHLHAEIGLACLQAGAHVLIEKPLANRVSEVDAMLAAAEAKNLKLGVLHQYRTHRSSKVLKQTIDSGKIGKIVRVLWSWAEFRPEKYYTRDKWRATWQHAGGGILMNQVSHDLDLLCWLVGQPAQVSAMIANQLHHAELEDIASANILFDNGAIATFQATINQPRGYSVRQIAGDKGIIIVQDVKSLASDNDDHIMLGTYEATVAASSQNLPGDHDQPVISWETCKLPASPQYDRTLLKRIARRFDKMILRKLTKSETILGRSEWLKWSDPVGHYALIRDFIEAILSDKAPMVSGASALATIELINAIILAAIRGKVVKLPLDRDEYDALFTELSQGTAEIPRLR
jgi:predicted dehydrogenase